MPENKPKKYYAVREGFVPGIYKTWDECKKQVMGFPNPKYKSFLSPEEAVEFMGTPNKNVELPSEGYIAYVDGSYDVKTKRYSCGVVVLHNSDIICKISKVGPQDAAATMRNVAGEILGSRKAIEYALENNIKKITIVHDYAGIAMWANKEWKRNKIWTQEYAEFVENARKKCDISFHKVKGHSNDKYNDMADQLAKDALGIK